MFTDDDNRRHRSASSNNWFSQGRDLMEERRYEDALFCFEEAERLGHPKSADAILLCKMGLGLT